MDVLEALKQAVATKSVSGSEGEVAEYIFTLLKDAGLSPRMEDRNVYCERGEGSKRLLLNSHIDTVPETDEWKRDPFKPEIEEGRLYGLGANDAKASVVTMLDAFVNAKFDEKACTLAYCATVEEETGGEGFEKLIKKIPAPDAVIIGEPTGLANICTAQKGLIKLKFTARGESGHASRPFTGRNAIFLAAESITKLRRVSFVKQHPVLGVPTIQVTMVQGGVRSNVIPPECSFIADGRTTPEYPNQELIDMISQRIDAEVEVLSKRIEPVATPDDAPIVRAAREALPDANVKPFGGISDLAFAGGIPGIVFGPGSDRQSHRADEYVETEQVKNAPQAYMNIISKFFEGGE